MMREVPWGEWVWVHVFSFLDAPHELARVRLVCSAWARLADDGSVWRAKCREVPAVQAALESSSSSTKKGRRYAPRLFTRNLKTADNALWKPLFRELSTFPMKGAGTGHLEYKLLRQGLRASSSDHPSQGIHQTLNPSLQTFWSSKGSADDQSSEFLVYRLVQPICIVHSVSITIYRAGYQKGIPVYGPQSLQVSVGFGPEKEDMHYTSPVYPVDNSAVEQTFELAPELVAGGFLRIDLYGRVQTQPDDDLYYTVLQRVVALGLPIAGLDKPVLSEALVRFAVSRSCFHKSLIDPPTPEPRKPPPKPAHIPAEHSDEDDEGEDEDEDDFVEDDDDDDERQLPEAADDTTSSADDLHELKSIVLRHREREGDSDDSLLCRQLLEVMQRQKEGTIGASQRAQQRKERIRTLLLEGKYSEAITTALDSPADEDVRTAEVVGWFWDADEAEKAGTANKTGLAKWAQEVKRRVSGRSEAGVLETYLQLALKRQKRLNEHETLAIVRALGSQHLHLIAFSAATGRLTCTEELGDLIAQYNQPLIAADIYMRAHVFDKVMVSLVEAANFQAVIRLAYSLQYAPDYVALLRVAKEKLSRRKALEFGLALAQGNHGASLLDLDQIKAALDIEMAQGEWDILGRLRRLVEDEAAAEGGEDDRAEDSEED